MVPFRTTPAYRELVRNASPISTALETWRMGPSNLCFQKPSCDSDTPELENYQTGENEGIFIRNAAVVWGWGVCSLGRMSPCSPSALLWLRAGLRAGSDIGNCILMANERQNKNCRCNTRVPGIDKAGRGR